MKKQITKNILISTLLTSSVIGCAGGSSIQSTSNTPVKKIHESIIVKGVTIVNTQNGQLQSNMAVMIDAGKISKIIPADMIGEQGGKRIIDATGKYLVPGYNDMHAHILDEASSQEMAAVMLAHGITGYRQMSGSDELLNQRKDNKLTLPEDSPELLGMPGPVLVRSNASTPEAATALVQKQRVEGADFIKVVDVSPSAFFAALAEAKKEGEYFAGHIPAGVDAVQASKQGMLSIEHLGPVDSVLISCSTNEAAARKAIGSEANVNMSAEIGKLTIANPLLVRLMANQNAFLKTRMIIDTYSDSKCKKVADTFANFKTWHVPTLIRNQTMQMADKADFSKSPNLQYVPRATREYWNEVSQQFTKTVKPVARETLRQLTQMDMKLVKLFDQQGVKMLTGSDVGGMWVVPGVSLHQEFDLLAKAGLTPLKVLQMTTLNSAEFLGKRTSMGTVEMGKDANLVLLDANPVQSVANLHKISAVIRDGKFYSQDTLEKLKMEAANKMAAATETTSSNHVH
ncbi:amidohydrolase family protein [Bdellovibrio sp. SKB1291214]|uniref:amidohydrolase family protein n=1 Tax=Bdellovibrio sp. SKB1291214 TaxID=1732569 RepID=UPI000B75D559|nr:amidohydrolase family protein [Bdellovibrio sp. SKB1291214]UYL09249.1 amidohydrolase family protein [Bdellovibrio sp. SKB1291214]